MSKGSIGIKLEHEGEVKRVNIVSPSFKELKDSVRLSFPALANATVDLKYVDEDKDLITITSDVEFDEAIKLSKVLGTLLKVNVYCKDKQGKKFR